jgi:cyanophycinase
MRSLIFRKTLFILLLTPLVSFSQSKVGENTTIGPKNGSLVIVGGGTLTEPILKRFIELAGGPEASIVVIPTADGGDSYDENAASAGRMRKLGAKKVTVLHTTDRLMANTDSFVLPLVNATGVWFGGGRQWRLVDAYKGTKTEKMFWDVLERGGVIGGSSAGATIQGSYLVRGDTRNNQIMMGDHEEGFGFVKNIAIDQHVMARNRQFDMYEIIRNRPELLGIAIDESTAIVVEGDNFQVLGESYVLVYDGSFWSREGSELKKLPEKNNIFYFLREGDKYNLFERKIIE